MEQEKLPFVDLKAEYGSLRGDILGRLERVLGSASFINGPEVAELEGALAEYVGARHVVTCANGTDALLLPLMAWDIRPGDAVFVPAFTFVATAEVAVLRGATPVFVDVDPATFNMDPADLERKIQGVRAAGELIPRAVVPVDLFGLVADYEAIRRVAAPHGLLILEDAAQSFGALRGGKPAGTFGDAAATSFFPAKPLGCYGDGGAIVTDDDSLAKALRCLRNHGSGAEKYEHVMVGRNSRLDTIQAAVLLAKLPRLPEALRRRREAAARYEGLLAGAVRAPKAPGGHDPAWAQYTVRVPPGRRDAVRAAMASEGVPTMVYYPVPLHLQPAYRPFGGRRGDCPVAEGLAAEVLSLPMHHHLEPSQQERVANALRAALAAPGD
jgi:dTDP-4-amino-4,6-dideoxygalactose transaminase